jgi:hypothetical protein
LNRLADFRRNGSALRTCRAWFKELRLPRTFSVNGISLEESGQVSLNARGGARVTRPGGRHEILLPKSALQTTSVRPSRNRSPRNLPGNGPQQPRTHPKACDTEIAVRIGVRPAALGFVCGCNALITQRSLVQIQPPQPGKAPGIEEVSGVFLSMQGASGLFSPGTPPVRGSDALRRRISG